MSALGHKRTYAVHKTMSALPPIATLIAHFADLHRLQTEPAQQKFQRGAQRAGAIDARHWPQRQNVGLTSARAGPVRWHDRPRA
jgi:hypothetical protein